MSRELEKLRKRSSEKINIAKRTLQESASVLDNHIGQVEKEYCRVADLSHKAPSVIEDLDRSFKEKTKLADSDIKFLFLCTAFQCARQYILTNDKFRISAVQGDHLTENAWDHTIGCLAPPSWKDVLFQSVPYDAIQAGNHVNASTGLSGVTHRYRTLGHDPVLGWVFGTANIMTNALTKTDFVTTYQVKDNVIIRHYPMGTIGMLNRAADYAKKDPMLLSAAAARQAIHFGSDYFTAQGLPVPLVASVNNDLAKTMILKGHIDMWSITRGAVLAALINQLIAVVHRLFYDEQRDGSETLYEIRTRKILSYSNALASGSNVLVVAFSKDLSKLDVGGMVVTLHRLISDYKFIQDVKRDFLKNEIYKMVVGGPYDFMEGC